MAGMVEKLVSQPTTTNLELQMRDALLTQQKVLDQLAPKRRPQKADPERAEFELARIFNVRAPEYYTSDRLEEYFLAGESRAHTRGWLDPPLQMLALQGDVSKPERQLVTVATVAPNPRVEFQLIASAISSNLFQSLPMNDDQDLGIVFRRNALALQKLRAETPGTQEHYQATNSLAQYKTLSEENLDAFFGRRYRYLTYDSEPPLKSISWTKPDFTTPIQTEVVERNVGKQKVRHTVEWGGNLVRRYDLVFEIDGKDATLIRFGNIDFLRFNPRYFIQWRHAKSATFEGRNNESIHILQHATDNIDYERRIHLFANDKYQGYGRRYGEGPPPQLPLPIEYTPEELAFASAFTAMELALDVDMQCPLMLAAMEAEAKEEAERQVPPLIAVSQVVNSGRKEAHHDEAMNRMQAFFDDGHKKTRADQVKALTRELYEAKLKMLGVPARPKSDCSACMSAGSLCRSCMRKQQQVQRDLQRA